MRRLLSAVVCVPVWLLLVAVDAGAQTTNQAPQFPSSETLRRVAEDAVAGTDIGMPVAAIDADGDNLTYSIPGFGAPVFDIVASSGQLRTKEPLDHENWDSHRLIVTVSDGRDAQGGADPRIDATIEVSVTVTNVDEPRALSLAPARIRVGTVVRARLSEPDGTENAPVWAWFRSADGTDWTPIEGAAEYYYTAEPEDARNYVRATVAYTDGLGDDVTLEAVTDEVVDGSDNAPGLAVTEHVTGLSIPWDIAFTPDNTMLYTERAGVLSARLSDGTVWAVTADVEDLEIQGEVGLMAMVVDPSFSSNRRFYTCQGHTGSEVQVIAWTINDAYDTATRVADPLIGGLPTEGGAHAGCRMRFGPDGYLWIATGDGARYGSDSQDLSTLGGKVLRVGASTGAGAPGNPFPLSPLIYTYGHRNPQGLALRPGTRQMWLVEHGPTIDDEINLLTVGGNYGWDPSPVRGQVGYPEDFRPMTDRLRYPGAIEAEWSSGSRPLATSGGIFLEGADWGDWEGWLAVASLRDRTLRVFEFAADGHLLSEVVVSDLDGTYGRLRTPMLGPDRALYVSTSNGGGADKILRVAPVKLVAPDRVGPINPVRPPGGGSGGGA